MTNKQQSTTGKVERHARLRWIPISEMRVSPVAQRDQKAPRVDKIAANFDIEQLGTPTVNEREGSFYIIDGAHRIAALKAIGYGDQQLQCWTYVGLTEQDEADMFLKLNDVLAVTTFDKFKVAVTAGWEVETDIDRIVRLCGLRISKIKVDGAVGCVGALSKAHNRGVLRETLQTIQAAYGDAGFGSTVVDGISLMRQRYGTDVDSETLVKRLSGAHGGVAGLLNRAEIIHRQTGAPKGHSVAAAATEFYNRGRGGRKLKAWWQDETAGVEA